MPRRPRDPAAVAAQKAPTSRLINTTAPLAGGGDLSGDRTLTIAAASASVPGSMSAADFVTLAALAVAPPAHTHPQSHVTDLVAALAGKEDDITSVVGGTLIAGVLTCVGLGGTPATSVVSETAYGQASAVGTGTDYARNDHKHGSPALGTSSTTACAGDDARLSDARTPTAHATTHKSGGADVIRLDELASPTASVGFNDQQGISFRIENRTTDPGTPTVGQIWLRTDL